VKPTTTSIQDPANPTDAELRQWAFSDELWPMQDFDLMVADLQRLPLVLELASSPKRAFFVHCLYLAVGDAARTSFNTVSREGVESALDRAATIAPGDPAIGRWIEDSRELLASPKSFDYEEWCDGGLASLAVEQPGP
jgi:hypothetical protein